MANNCRIKHKVFILTNKYSSYGPDIYSQPHLLHSPQFAVYFMNSKQSAVAPIGHIAPASATLQGLFRLFLHVLLTLQVCGDRANSYSIFKLQTRWLHFYDTVLLSCKCMDCCILTRMYLYILMLFWYLTYEIIFLVFLLSYNYSLMFIFPPN